MAPLNLAQLPDELMLSMLDEKFPARHQQTRALATLLHVSYRHQEIVKTNLEKIFMANSRDFYSLMLRLVAIASYTEQRPLGKVLLWLPCSRG